MSVPFYDLKPLNARYADALQAAATRVIDSVWYVLCEELAAFWLTRTQAVTQLFLFLLLFLGGEAAPLTLLPGWVQVVAWWSPTVRLSRPTRAAARAWARTERGPCRVPLGPFTE